MRTRGILFGALAVLVLVCGSVSAQNTEFSYQGSLKDGGNLATGNYDLEFALYDALAGGSQVGPTLTRSTVAATNGTFNVSLDFGNQFPGTARYLEVRVRPSGAGAFTTLLPRQAINSSPYSVKSLAADNAANATNATNATTAANASQLGGVSAGQYVVTNDPRMTDARNPLPNGQNYIQNQNAAPQATSNFNISGDGTVGGNLNVGGALSLNIVNAATQYNLGGQHILSNPGSGNLFAGIEPGMANTSGYYNAFFGGESGQSNTTGYENSFFGSGTGRDNTTGGDNSFFGKNAGITNTTGFYNTFAGAAAGTANKTGFSNSFFGSFAGVNSNANFNTFIGTAAGNLNTTGSTNTFVGTGTGAGNSVAGAGNVTGSNNSLFGNNADVAAGNLSNATAIGANAFVSQSNSIVLGSINGVNGAGADTKVGVGTSTPAHRLSVIGGPAWTSNSWGGAVELGNASAIGWRANAGGQRFGIGQSTGGLYFFRTASDPGTVASPANYDVEISDAGNLLIPAGNVGIGTATPALKLDVNGSVVFRPGGTGGGAISFGTPSFETGITINGSGTNRADVRFDNSTLKLVAGPAGGPPASTSGIAINTQGFVGIGTVSPTQAKLHVDGSQFNAVYGSSTFKGVWGEGTGNTSVGVYGTNSGPNSYGLYGIASGTTSTGVYGKGTRYGGYFDGLLAVAALDVAGANTINLCRNPISLALANCASSSLRYKKNLAPYAGGLAIVNRLRPITFDWKQGGSRDVGFGAEDVAAVEPLLITRNEKGEVEGVKYDHMAVVLVNAIKEQQKQIETQQKQIGALLTVNAALNTRLSAVEKRLPKKVVYKRFRAAVRTR